METGGGSSCLQPWRDIDGEGEGEPGPAGRDLPLRGEWWGQRCQLAQLPPAGLCDRFAGGWFFGWLGRLIVDQFSGLARGMFSTLHLCSPVPSEKKCVRKFLGQNISTSTNVFQSEINHPVISAHRASPTYKITLHLFQITYHFYFSKYISFIFFIPSREGIFTYQN